MEFQELFEEIKKEFPEVRKVKEDDCVLISNEVKRIEEEGYFYYSNFPKRPYPLADINYLKSLIKSKNHLLMFFENDNFGFTHLEKYGKYISWSYTFVRKKGKGLGKKFYESGLKVLNKYKIPYCTEFVLSVFFPGIWKIWRKYGIKTAGIFMGKEYTKEGKIAHVYGVRIFSKPKLEIQIPSYSFNFISKILEDLEIDARINEIKVKPMFKIEPVYDEVIISFNHNSREIVSLSEKGFINTGIDPEMGLIFSKFAKPIEDEGKIIYQTKDEKLREVWKEFEVMLSDL